MKKISFCLLALILTACSAGIKYQESFISKELSFTNLKNSTITVFGTSNIILTEFIETFKDEYSDTTKLNNKIISDFKSQFASQLPTIKVKSGKGKIPAIFVNELSFKEDNKTTIDEFFNNLDSDYLIFINTLDIGNSYDTYTHYNAAPNMPGSMMTSSMEKCNVSTEIECWDVKKQNRIFKIKSYGSSTVVLFTFLNSLNSALSEAIENGVMYIANDGKK